MESQVMTASPYRLHQMIVEAALRHARRGLEEMGQGHYEIAEQYLAKSRACLTEMISGIREDQSSEIGGRAKSLFVFSLRKFSLATIERKSEYITDGLKILETHYETWLLLGRQINNRPATPNTISSTTGMTSSINFVG